MLSPFSKTDHQSYLVLCRLFFCLSLGVGVMLLLLPCTYRLPCSNHSGAHFSPVTSVSSFPHLLHMSHMVSFPIKSFAQKQLPCSTRLQHRKLTACGIICPGQSGLIWLWNKRGVPISECLQVLYQVPTAVPSHMAAWLHSTEMTANWMMATGTPSPRPHTHWGHKQDYDLAYYTVNQKSWSKAFGFSTYNILCP